MSLRKGFTLIELLVVIAIIGILSSVVLASLNTARTKGQDASAKASMNNVRATGEITYDDDGAYTNVCADAATLLSAAGTQTGTTAVCADVAGSYAAEIQLRSTQYYCVDSTGFAGIAAGSTRVAADTATACDPS